jgi:ferredoxin-NADP reductase
MQGVFFILKTNIKATVNLINQATNKIKIFRLDLGQLDYIFKPGQWIDLEVPIEGKNIGGYTIISTPSQKGFIELAIRDSKTHPVTHYLHHQLKIGDTVNISLAQGNFYLPKNLNDKPIVFIAGGIGITPLISMIRSQNNINEKVQLFYSVAHEDDILLKDELPKNSVICVTQKENSNWKGITSRISLKLMLDNNIDLNSLFFICGPKQLINNVSEELYNAGVPKNQVHFEKWW